MSTYNLLTTELTCPRCNSTTMMEVNCYFGCTGLMKSYRVGDIYDWPLLTDIKGTGYTECPTCRRDFFAVVYVVSDRIEKVEPDLTRAPYCRDARVEDLRLTCPLCGCSSIAEIHLYDGYTFGRVVTDCPCNHEMHVDLLVKYGPQVEIHLEPDIQPYVFETDVEEN